MTLVPQLNRYDGARSLGSAQISLRRLAIVRTHVDQSGSKLYGRTGHPAQAQHLTIATSLYRGMDMQYSPSLASSVTFLTRSSQTRANA